MKSIYDSIGLLVLRVGLAGLMLYNHGLDKLLHFNEKAEKFPDPIGLGTVPSLGLTTFAEFFCSLAIILGYFTRWAAIPQVINMAVAFAVVHGPQPLKEKELPLLFLLGFVSILILGPGRYSLDNAWRKKY